MKLLIWQFQINLYNIILHIFADKQTKRSENITRLANAMKEELNMYGHNEKV